MNNHTDGKKVLRRAFNNPKLAESEAWLTGGYFIEDTASKSYLVLTAREIKDRIKSAITEEKYDSATALTEALQRQPQFSGESRQKSIRVSFSVYLQMVDEAFDEAVALKDLVSKKVIADLGDAIDRISIREEVDRTKLSLLKGTFEKWKKEQGSTLQRDVYRPSLDVPQDPPKKALVAKLIETEARKHSDQLRQEAFFEIFRGAQAEIDEADADPKKFIYPEIRKNERKRLVLSLIFTTGFSIKGAMSRYVDRYGEETFSRISSLFAIKDPELLTKYAPQVALLSVNPILEDGEILISVNTIPDGSGEFIGKIPASEFGRSVLDGDLAKQATRSLQAAKTKALQALDGGDLATVMKLTRTLEAIQRENEITRFAVTTLLNVLRSSQVVNFQAPDVVIRLWEAYGDTTLSGRPKHLQRR